MLPRKYIVQDLESKCFLYPSDCGDVGFTEFAHEAGRFDFFEEAEDTAKLNCFSGFFITPVFE